MSLRNFEKSSILAKKNLAKIEEIFFIITTLKVLNVLVKKKYEYKVVELLGKNKKKNQIINTIIIHPGMMYKNLRDIYMN